MTLAHEPGPTVTPFLARDGKAVPVLGNGRQRWAPVYREDVVAAIVRALDGGTPAGRFDLTGPDVMTVDDFVRAVNGGAVRVRHIPALFARVLGRVVPTLTPALADILIGDSLGAGEAAEAAFHLRRHRVGDVYGAPQAAAPVGELHALSAPRGRGDRGGT